MGVGAQVGGVVLHAGVGGCVSGNALVDNLMVARVHVGAGMGDVGVSGLVLQGGAGSGGDAVSRGGAAQCAGCVGAAWGAVLGVDAHVQASALVSLVVVSHGSCSASPCPWLISARISWASSAHMVGSGSQGWSSAHCSA